VDRRTYFILFLVGLILPVTLAQFQPVPGYIDADYYFAGGIQLVSGHGFNEPYLWNYLDGTTSLPHPSHTYWMPLASIVSALGMWLLGGQTYAAARLPFILIAAFVVPLTAALAYSFSQRRGLAIASALLAVFSIFNAPFVGVTDNYSLLMLFGSLYFILCLRLAEDHNRPADWAALGLLAGLTALSRSDGLLWLPLTFALAGITLKNGNSPNSLRKFFGYSALALIGFLLVMAPWYLRNLHAFGSLMAPGGSRTLWLGAYVQTFIYPPELLSLKTFLALGWNQILDVRFAALWANIKSAVAAHGGMILFPFIVYGIVKYWKMPPVKIASLGWTLLFLVMTFIFPFAGPRGAFFHAGAAFQPMWWTLAPLGLDQAALSLRKRNLIGDRARVILRSVLALIAALLTVFVIYLRIFSLGWGEGEAEYPAVEKLLIISGIQQNEIVIVRNPPGYFTSTGRGAIVIPYGTEALLMQAAKQFKAHYLVLEPQGVYPALQGLRENPHSQPGYIFLGEVNGIYIFRLEY